MKRPGSLETGRYWAQVTRRSLLEPLPSHEALVRDHQGRVHSLFLIAVALGVEPTELGFIIADLAGEFGKACLEQGAGVEFVVPAAAARSAAIVIPLDLAGLVAIMNAVLPEAASLVTTKPADGTPFLVVDADDEPAVVFVDAPAEEAPCA